ncbi:unnamed protein product [Schistocephalus solidus]|uniref:Endo/exonuclease/phosphatase domain-containing protein n=1 Tax=Schistocephalus solidus TaxID=70667 RepID=A0A183SEB2_SCHSO|nr:unnamed protein product [Schistocephalus solidus]
MNNIWFELCGFGLKFTSLHMCEVWTYGGFSGYAYIRNDRHKGRGGGSCIYVRQPLSFFLLDCRQFTAVEESCWLRVVLKDNYSLLVGSVYRPPNTSEDYDLCLSLAFHAAADLNLKYCLIAGDFNLPEVHWFPTSGPTKFEDLLEAIDIGMWDQVVDFPTRGSSILHLIFCRGCQTLSVLPSDPLGNSDHTIVISTLELEAAEKFSEKYSFFRDFRSANMRELLTHLNSNDWTNFFVCSDMNVCTDTFYKVVGPLISRFVPRKKIINVKDEVYLPLSFRRRLRRLSRRFHLKNDTSVLPLIQQIFKEAKRLSDEKRQADEVNFAENPSFNVAKLFSCTV